MPKPIPSYLRLYTERLPCPAEDEAAYCERLDQACQGFVRHAGWRLTFEPEPPRHDPDLLWSAPVNPGVGAALGHISIRRAHAAAGPDARLSNEAAAALGEMVRMLAADVLQMRRALRQREAELAACVPVVPHRHEGAHLAQRLEAVLCGGAKALGCDAAALYLLDAATTELKLRACWGLPGERLLAPPRPLADAIADLEALSGHAVAVEQPSSAAVWRLPELYAAALCVPVSTPTVPLGTLWVFSRQARQFTETDQHIAEIVAGRLAADLERHAMLQEGAGDVRWRRQFELAAQVWRSQLPQVAPLSDTWDLAGLSDPEGLLGGAFHDWFVPREDCLAVSLGHCPGTGVAAALQAAALRGLLRGAASHAPSLGAFMARVNQELWQMAAGDHTASVFHALLAESKGEVSFAAAGGVRVHLFTQAGWQPMPPNGPALGVDLCSSYSLQQRLLERGEFLVAVTPGTLAAEAENTRPHATAWLSEALADNIDAPARLLAEVLHNRWQRDAGQSACCGLLIVKRR